MADSIKVQSMTRYYARLGYGGHLQTMCKAVVQQNSADAVAHFWLIYGKLLEGRSSEAIQDLRALSASPEISPAASAALILAHQSAKVVDNDAILNLTSQMEVLESSCSDHARLILAQFYWHSGSKERARMLVERVLRESKNDVDAQALLGWIMLSQQDDEYDLGLEDETDEALELFEGILIIDQHLEALLGKAKVLEMKKKYREAVELLREIVVRNPWFYPVIIEAARLHVGLGDWEQGMEMVHRVLKTDPGCIDALAIKATHHIICEGDNKAAASVMQDLKGAIASWEPRNADLHYRLAQQFARVAGENTSILDASLALAEQALHLAPDNTAYAFEVGYQRMLLGGLDSALQQFQVASTLEELDMDVMYGTVECQIRRGMIEDAESQLQMLSDVSVAGACPSYAAYLKCLLALRKGINPEQGSILFEKAGHSHLKDIDSVSIGNAPFVKLNMTRLLELVEQSLHSLGGEPRGPTEAPSPYLPKIMRVLNAISNYAPGHLQTQLAMARTQFLDGNLDAALSKACEIQRFDPQEPRGHLLVCQIYHSRGKTSSARLALDEAVGASFSVRKLPSFHILNARVLMAEGKLEETKTALEGAMALPGVRVRISLQQKSKYVPKQTIPTLYERVTIYILLAQVLNEISKDAPEATKVITDALREFDNTAEIGRVIIADCDLIVKRGDTQLALKKLKKIGPSSPHFRKARMAMADIHLTHRKDKAAYVQCYIDLSKEYPGYDTSWMLGEALMRIQEPEKAIHAFEDALEHNPKNSDLALQIACALVTTHEYERAIDFFNKAIRNSPSRISLYHDLAMLFFRLQRYDQAENVLNKSMNATKQASRVVEQRMHLVDTWVLLAKVYKGRGNIEEFMKAHQEAATLQADIVAMLRGEHPDLVAAQKEKSADLCVTIADHYRDERQMDKALELYKEALHFWDGHKIARKSLAQLYLSQGDIDMCQHHCQAILDSDPDSEEAGIMLAEIMFHKDHYETATYHFQELLERNPENYRALANLIRILRSAGKLEEIEKRIQRVEVGKHRAGQEPGLCYCRGLNCCYTNKPSEALNQFNIVRKDSAWSTAAIFEMASIVLNPDGDFTWIERNNESAAERIQVARSATRLLEQVVSKDRHMTRFKVLQCYALMVTKDESDVRLAINKLMEIANKDPQNVPVLLASAIGFMILKQTPKARNQLKRVQKIQFKFDEVDDFERAWLLLADIHIQGGKFDLAQDLCKRCLKYNKSCGKAWEYMGQIMEREQAYQDAARHYENAWKFENETSASVGYKLAFNFLKAQRFVEAIDVCNRVLKNYPEYPRLREEVLQKAIAGLKP